MTNFVLTYQGAPERQPQAEALLRAKFPWMQLFRKTAFSYEVPSNGQLAGDEVLLGTWKVSPVSYAEVGLPETSLRGMQKKLAELRGARR